MMNPVLSVSTSLASEVVPICEEGDPGNREASREMPFAGVTTELEESLREANVVAVIPAHNESRKIELTLSSIPRFIRSIVVVDDASTDATAELVQQLATTDPRIVLVRHQRNEGVGGAMVTGYKRALKLAPDIVVKMDADGQMSPEDLPALLRPLLLGEADYSKGNRFVDLRRLGCMPLLRRMGNMALSFLTKAAVGYWDLFDPCNGYVAIRGEVLSRLPMDAIQRSFFFETSMLAQLYLMNAVVKDVPMPARYGDERSHLSIRRVLGEFPRKLLGCFVRRMLLKNFLFDFSIESVYLLTGVPLLLAGMAYGGMNWIRYSLAGVGAPTGTVVISAMLVILGFQLVLSALGEDLRRTPREPLCQGMIATCRTHAGGRNGELGGSASLRSRETYRIMIGERGAAAEPTRPVCPSQESQGS